MMAATYYMLQIPPVLFFILIVLFGASVAALTTFLFRRYVRLKVQRAHNEVTGFLFLAIASFYALLLSFVIFVVWDESNNTHSIVSKEGSAAMVLYRDIKFYPDSVSSMPLKAAYLDYVFNVVDEEFPNMARMELTRKTPESFDKVLVEMLRISPQTPTQVELLGTMLTNLDELAMLRGERITTMHTEIAPPIWLPMIFGGIITLLCAILLDIEHRRMHIFLTSLLGAFIAMFFFTIILLDHPFTGSLAIKPTRYKQIFTSEQWVKDAATVSPLPTKE
jgi:hypothetical protein